MTTRPDWVCENDQRLTPPRLPARNSVTVFIIFVSVRGGQQHAPIHTRQSGVE